MTRKNFILIFAGFVALTSAVNAQPSCDTTFNGGAQTEDWSTPENWSDNVPNSGKVACITGGVEVSIDYGHFENAKAIYVDSTSVLEIYAGGALTLCGEASCVASQVDGELEIFDTSSLKLGQSVTINGSGAIVGFPDPPGLGGSPSKIEAVSGSPVLTLASGITLEGAGDVLVDIVCNGDIDATNELMKFYEGLTLNGSMTITAGTVVEVSENFSVASGKNIIIGSYGASIGQLKARSGYSPAVTVASGATLQGAGEVYLPTTINGTGYAYGGDLTFKSSMSLAGTLRIEGSRTAFVSQNLTVASGATVWMENSGGYQSMLKPASGTSPTLTVSSGGLIKGAGEIHFAPTNNGTVAARDGTLELKLGGSGSGKWTAETSTGRLLVSGTVSGSGLWELDDNASAKIEIDAACACLTGNATFTKGTLDVDANFATSGELTFGGKDTLIDVAATKSAKFSQPTGCMEQ